MSKTKVHYAYFRSFGPICGANPKELRLAECRHEITCKTCRRIMEEPMVWSEDGTRLLLQKQYPEGEICPPPPPPP